MHSPLTPSRHPGCRLAALLLGLALFAATWGASAAPSLRILVYTTPLAGSQYYALDALWPQLQVGDRLELMREAGNRHDGQAIRVDWRGQKLGYLPRAANRVVAAAMDRGDTLVGRIAALQRHADPWQRLRIEVFVEL